MREVRNKEPSNGCVCNDQENTEWNRISSRGLGCLEHGRQTQSRHQILHAHATLPWGSNASMRETHSATWTDSHVAGSTPVLYTMNVQDHVARTPRSSFVPHIKMREPTVT